MRRLTVALVFAATFTAAFSHVYRLYAKKTYDITGPAQWIWAQHRVSRNVPVVFFAVRDFDLPANRLFTRLKILGDPEYTLFVNGRQLASRRVVEEDRHLEEYDLAPLVRTGRNRLLVAVRSTDGVGGLIAAVDLGPELENAIVTDGQWKIFRVWRDDLPLRDSPTEPPQRPMFLGQPPAGKWNYLRMRTAVFDPPPTKVVEPRGVAHFVTAVPTVEIREGVAVAGIERRPAVAYDFGPTAGRVRLTLLGPPLPPRRTEPPRDTRPGVVRIRYANNPWDFALVETAVYDVPFGPGERTLTEPVVEHFRYVVVIGGTASAEVVQ